MRGRKRLFRYKLSPDAYQQMLATQHNRCKVCLKPFTSTPCVDHNHRTGAVRGLLCRACNAGLGFLRESDFVFVRAVAYLQMDSGWLLTRFVDLPRAKPPAPTSIQEDSTV